MDWKRVYSTSAFLFHLCARIRVRVFACECELRHMKRLSGGALVYLCAFRLLRWKWSCGDVEVWCVWRRSGDGEREVGCDLKKGVEFARH